MVQNADGHSRVFFKIEWLFTYDVSIEPCCAYLDSVEDFWI